MTDDRRAGFKTSAALTEAAVEIVYPHQFAANTVFAHPEAGVRALTVMSARMTDPPQAPLEVLGDLRVRYGMEAVAEILAPLLVSR